MSASGDFRRWPVEPGIPGIVRVFDPYCYRCPFGATEDTCSRQCVSHIEEVIQMEGPQNIAAMLAEGITGTNGLLVPPADYWPRVRALLDKYDILLIDDEVMAGLRAHRQVVRHPALRHQARHDHLRQGHHQQPHAAGRRSSSTGGSPTSWKTTCCGPGSPAPVTRSAARPASPAWTST